MKSSEILAPLPGLGARNDRRPTAGAVGWGLAPLPRLGQQRVRFCTVTAAESASG
ncbi:MAG: hypothetical protein L6Q93_01665 [Phycisphaerae bacterium]|nr:hypothetical protein [Phycisphaerae bacterium]NUQ07813.1 hypothetical protein [Phycisphaerae bacterium]